MGYGETALPQRRAAPMGCSNHLAHRLHVDLEGF
jgi:hypothetical protein